RRAPRAALLERQAAHQTRGALGGHGHEELLAVGERLVEVTLSQARLGAKLLDGGVREAARAEAGQARVHEAPTPLALPLAGSLAAVDAARLAAGGRWHEQRRVTGEPVTFNEKPQTDRSGCGSPIKLRSPAGPRRARGGAQGQLLLSTQMASLVP